MQQKIGWLALWVTLAFWAGCANVEDQNYKINQEQEPLFEERYPTQPNEGASAEPAQDSDSGSDPASEPSLDGLERDHWGRVAVAPVSGRVLHYPYYFSRHGSWRTWRYSTDRPSPLLADAGIERQADRVTRGARAGYDAEQIGDAILGPPKFAKDLVTLPYQMWRTPPWRVVYSPVDP